jgi:hypothetical protein
MITVCNLIIEDWVSHHYITTRYSRRVKNTSQEQIDIANHQQSDDPEEIRVELAYTSKNNLPSKYYWIVIFCGCSELFYLHKEMFKEKYDYDYPTKEEAMQHIDLFLDKLVKLKIFL